jgi:DNA-binding response OmpR family regulator
VGGGKKRERSREVRKDRVLIVEDDAAIRDSLQILFEDEGYAALVAHNGQDALDVIPTLPNPTVILLDLRMPRVDGYGVLCDLAAHPEKRDDHPIFLLTANIGQLTPDMVRLLGEQGVPVLPKPFDVDSLLANVRGALDGIR